RGRALIAVLHWLRGEDRAVRLVDGVDRAAAAGATGVDDTVGCGRRGRERVLAGEVRGPLQRSRCRVERLQQAVAAADRVVADGEAPAVVVGGVRPWPEEAERLRPHRMTSLLVERVKSRTGRVVVAGRDEDETLGDQRVGDSPWERHLPPPRERWGER